MIRLPRSYHSFPVRRLPGQTSPVRRQTHRFALGQRVTLAPSPGIHLSRDVKALMASTFEIARLLPRDENSFFYRVKDLATGQERVAAEHDLTCLK